MIVVTLLNVYYKNNKNIMFLFKMNCPAYNFFISTVRPTVIDFHNSPLEIRKARLASIVLCHMIDHWALKNTKSREKKELEDLVRVFKIEARKIPGYSLIIDVADASKHAKLFLPKNNERLFYDSENITNTSGFFEEPFGEGYFAEACVIYALLEDGTEKALLEPCLSILGYWERKFKDYDGIYKL